MSEFTDYVNRELPRRAALLTPSISEVGGYDGDPNDGAAPQILKSSPAGTLYYEESEYRFWEKYSSAEDDWKLGGAIGKTVAELDIYVRDDGGDDSNRGTISSPIATLARADSLIPFHIDHVVRIHLGPHTGNGYEQHSFMPRNVNSRIYIIGDGAGGGTDGFTVVKTETAALSGTTSSSVISSGLSTTEYGGLGELFGKTIQINSGSAAGDRRTIRNNTATEIFPNAPFSETVSPGDLYEILEPEVEIYDTTGTNSPPFINGFNTATGGDQLIKDQNYFCLVNLKFTTSVTSYVTLNFGPGNILMYGIYFEEEVRLISSGGSIRSGFELYDFLSIELSCPTLVADLSLTRDKQWLGWGISTESESAGQGTIWFNSGSFKCDGFFNGEQLSVLDSTKCSLYGGSFWGSDGFSCIIVRGNSSELSILAIVNDIIIGTTNQTVGAIAGYDGSKISINSAFYDINIYSSSHSIASFERGAIDVQGGTGDININSSAGIGMITTEDGQIILKGNPPVINAALGDLSEDYGGNIRDISDLTTYGDAFIDIYHGRIWKGYP